MRVLTGPSLAAGGDAVSRGPDGRVMFVAGAAPDELVDVEIEEDNPTFLRARVARVVSPGATRRAPPCEHYGTCGGCTLQHVSPEEQVRSKEVAVRETLRRIGKVDLERVTFDPAWSAASSGYRVRARLAIDGARRAVGFRAAESRAVVDITHCLVLAPPLQRGLERVRDAVLSFRGELPRDEELEVVASGDRALIGLPRRLEGLRAQLDRDDAIRPARGSDDALLEEGPLGRLYHAPNVFAQGNAEGNRVMVEDVRRFLTDPSGPPPVATSAPGVPAAAGSGAPAPRFDHLFELYSGSGNLTRVLAPIARKVSAFEGSVPAARLARRVLPANVEVLAEPVERALGRVTGRGHRPDAVVLDPPRGGASKEVLAAITELGPRVVLYVSCDAATFARDLGRLGRFALTRLRVFDLYPHTAHVEVVGLLERRET